MNAIKKKKLIPRPWICLVCKKPYQSGEGYVLYYNGRNVGYHCAECKTPAHVLDKEIGLVPVVYFDQGDMIKRAHGGKK